MALADDSGGIPAAIPIVGPAGLSIVGPQGKPGPEGKQGPVGPMGSVSPEQLQSAVAPVDARVARLEVSLQTGYITRQTYAEIAALTLSATATYVVPDTDTGTHAGISSEFGYSGGQVPNAGTFSATGSPLALRRVAATGTAAIPGIQADLAGIRSTRYWSRPGELIGSWTTEVEKKPTLATPLAVGTGVALGSVPGAGQSLLLTGTAKAGPIAWVWIEPGKVYRGRALLARTAPDTTDNTVLARIRVFQADGAVVTNPVSVGTTPLLAADGVKEATFTISTVPGAADYQFPIATGGYAHLYYAGGVNATNGQFAVSQVTFGLEAASFGDQLASATVVTAIRDTQYAAIFDEDKRTPHLITFAAFKDLMMEKKIFKPARGTVPAAGALWMSPDATRNSARFINNGVSGNVLLGVGKAPVAGTDYTIAFGPGDTVDLDRETGSIYMATDSGADIPIYGGFTNSSGFDARGDAAAYDYISRISGNQTQAELKIITDYVIDLNTAEVLSHLRMMFLLAHTDSISARVDLVRKTPRLLLGSTAPSFTKYVGYTGDGLAAYADTQYFPKDDAAVSFTKHGFGVYAMNNTTNATNKYSLANPSASICANRTGITASTRSGFTPGNEFTTVDSYGGLFAVSRQVASNYDVIHNQNKYNKPTAGTTWGTVSYSMYLFAVNQAGGAAGFSSDTLGLCYADDGMPPEKHMAIATAFAKYRAALAAL